MTDKIKALLAKYRELIMYLIFGVLTTVVSFAAYYLLLWCGIHYIAAQIISWAAAVAFAFVVNKIFVFEDKDNSPAALLRQIGQFVSVRIASGVIETVLLWLLVDIIRQRTLKHFQVTERPGRDDIFFYTVSVADKAVGVTKIVMGLMTVIEGVVIIMIRSSVVT